MAASKGLKNPAAVALAPSAMELAGKAFEFQGRQVDFLQKNAKPILLTVAAVTLIYFGPKWYKKLRAENYAKKNIGRPEVTAAAIIYNSFSRFEPKGFLGLILPSFNISTNEEALYDIARKVSNITEVAKAYSILFDRNLLFDIQDGLNSKELNTFVGIINGKDGNPDIKRTILAGSKVFNAKKETIAVKEAVLRDGVWKSTNNLFANVSPNEPIGEVVSSHIYEPTGSRYYIVKKCSLFVVCNYGLVWDFQVTDKKI